MEIHGPVQQQTLTTVRGLERYTVLSRDAKHFFPPGSVEEMPEPTFLSHVIPEMPDLSSIPFPGLTG